MTFEEKSKESLESLEVLRENGKYNSCINRAYYSLYQKILHKLDILKLTDKVNNEFKNQKEKGSHEFTIDYYVNKEFAIKAKNKAQVIMVNTCAYSLKKLRHIADYEKNSISEKDVSDAIRFIQQFNNLVK